MRLQSSFRTLLDYETKEDELTTEMAELQSEIDKIDAQENKLKEDEAEIEEAIEEEEEYLDELVDDLPGESSEGEIDDGDADDENKNPKQDGAFMPTQHQMYLAYQTALSQVECGKARGEAEERGDTKAVQEKIGEECVAKSKELMQRLIHNSQEQCDKSKDQQECKVVGELVHLVENAEADIIDGEDGIWPKSDQSGVTQDGAFVPTQHQMYLAYQIALAEVECDDARAEVKKDQQEEEEEAESGNKAEEEAIEKDMAEAEEEIAKECVEKKDLMQTLIKEAEDECDWDRDEQECEVVNKLLDLVENAKEDIKVGEVGIWPKSDVIDEGKVTGKDEEKADNTSNVDTASSREDDEVVPPSKEEKMPGNIEKNDSPGNGDNGVNDVNVDLHTDLASLESKLTDAEEECTEARSALPEGFELRVENAEEIQAVNEGCCLGQYAADAKCEAAIPKAECDVFLACAEAKSIADQLRNKLDNNLDIAEAKCREGAQGILVENQGKSEGPYDNLDDLDIIRMTCCLAPYDADMVYCQDKAQVAQVRTNNRCNLLEYCLEANHLETSLTEEQTATEGAVDGQVGHQNELDHGSSHSWSAAVWLALMFGLLVASVLVIRRKRRKARQRTSIFGERRFSRGSMPSHVSSRRWNEDAEYGLSEHAAQLSLDHDEDTTSFAPAFTTSVLYGGQGFS